MGLRPRGDIEWHATILFTCPSVECDAVYVLGQQPRDKRCGQCHEYDLERVEYVPRRFVGRPQRINERLYAWLERRAIREQM